MKLKTRLGTIILLLVWQQQVALGQEQKSLRDKAEILYESGEYAQSALLFTKLIDKKPRIKDVQRIANSYLQINNYDLAENWYARLIGMGDTSQNNRLAYAGVLKKQGKYGEAKKVYEQLIEQARYKEIAVLQIAGCDSASMWMSQPKGYDIDNESKLNTSNAEFGAFQVNDNVFYTGEPISVEKTSGMTGKPYLNVFMTTWEGNGGNLSAPEMLDKNLNTRRYHVGPIAVNKDKSLLFLTRTYDGGASERFRKNGNTVRRYNLELMIYRKVADQWIEEDFPYNDVKSFSTGHAALSEDEQVLYFASDRPGGVGGVDIWYSEKTKDGTWGIPRNAGSTVNSAGDELFPTVFGNTLYYASDGFVGMGGLDIFSVSGGKSAFTNRMNLGFPVNSASDDFYYTVTEEDRGLQRGYLSSDRKGGLGSDDIYSFQMKSPRITIRLIGRTVNKETSEIVPNAGITLFDTKDNILIKTVGDTQGAFTFPIEAHSGYRLYADHAGYVPDSLQLLPIIATKDTTIEVVVRLQPVMKVGTKFVLENIYYDFDKADIRPDAAAILNKLVTTLRDNPTLKIELSSHTDSRGADSYNDKLSQRRAQSAVDYISSQGIDRTRLVAKGYGERRLVNKCANGVSCSLQEHQENRRTEVEVLAF